MIAAGMRGLVRRADVARVGGDRDLDRVVVAVIAPLDLDDQVPAGDGAHQVDGVHGRLGARVGESPLRQAEPAAQFLGHDHRVLGRLGEVRAEPGLRADRLDHGRVRVPGQRGAVPAVQVDVLVAVDVVDLGAAAVAQPDRLRDGDLPAGRHPAGQRPAGPGGHPRRPGLPPQEDLLLLGDDVRELLVSAGHGALLS